MSLNADILLERIHLKNQARRWRIAALVVVVLAALLVFQQFRSKGVLDGSGLGMSHIARYTIDEVIFDDVKRSTLLREIEEDDAIKALILRIDSPGGTTVGSEQFYLDLRRIAKKKPVVATLRSVAASGGYMAAIGSDYILAREGTITGSIGVIMQSAELTELAKKLGITPVVVRSGDLKASPTPLEALTPKAEEMLEGLIGDFYQYFIGLVKDRRKLSEEQVAYISDGRVVSARQALEQNLIDAIGGEREALAWLAKEHKIDKKLNIEDYKVPKDTSPLKELLDSSVEGTIFEKITIPLDGLVSIWQPSVLN